MGIYDRDYYRDEVSRSPWVTGAAPITLFLIVANVGFLVFRMLGGAAAEASAVEWLSLDPPDQIFGRLQLWRLVTSSLLHSGIWHLLWNMLCLWWFGRELEMLYGPREYGCFTLGAVVLPATAEALVGWVRESPVPSIGTSASVMAVLVVYALYYPREPIYFYGLIRVPMAWFVGLYLVADVAVLAGGEGGVMALGPLAHVVAAVYGFLFKWLDLRVGRVLARGRRTGSIGMGERREPGPGRAGRDPSPPTSSLDEALETRLDQILEKLHRDGRESLTDDELQALEHASRQLRKRGSRSP